MSDVILQSQCTAQSGCTDGYGLVQSGCGLLGNPLSSYVEVWGDGTSDVYPNWTDCVRVNRVIYREGCGLSGEPQTSWVTLYENGEKVQKSLDRRCASLSCGNRTLYTEWRGTDLVAVRGDQTTQVLSTRPLPEQQPRVLMSGSTKGGQHLAIMSNGTIVRTQRTQNSKTISQRTGREVDSNTLSTSTVDLVNTVEVRASGCGLLGYTRNDFIVQYWKDRIDVYPKANNCKAVSLIKKGCNTFTGEYVKIWSDGTRESYPDGECLAPQFPQNVNSPDSTQ